jgi:hypothetical protein
MRAVGNVIYGIQRLYNNHIIPVCTRAEKNFDGLYGHFHHVERERDTNNISMRGMIYHSWRVRDSILEN